MFTNISFSNDDGNPMYQSPAASISPSPLRRLSRRFSRFGVRQLIETDERKKVDVSFSIFGAAIFFPRRHWSMEFGRARIIYIVQPCNLFSTKRAKLRDVAIVNKISVFLIDTL